MAGDRVQKFSFKSTRKLWRNCLYGCVLTWRLVADSVLSDKGERARREPDSPVAIIGGELFNKGAQGMTFTLVDWLRREYPDARIVLFSDRDYQRSNADKEPYAFDILPWGPDVVLRLLTPTIEGRTSSRWPGEVHEEIYDVISSARMMVDINGYALSAQFGFRRSLAYIANLVVARRHNLPIYLLPQSFGPFDYPFPKGKILEQFFKTYLRYPECMFAREKAGYELLAAYADGNLKRSFDIVLQERDYKTENIYRSAPPLRQFDIPADSVGVVPNMQVLKRVEATDLYSAYESIIELLLSAGRSIYIFRHSEEDVELCRRIKGPFDGEEDVVLLSEDFNAIELEHIIKQLRYLIASRYHSIIHAYRNSVPVVAIGWAVKYQELLEAVGQSSYAFDGRGGLVKHRLVEAVRLLDRSYEEEAVRIGERVRDIRTNSIRNVLS